MNARGVKTPVIVLKGESSMKDEYSNDCFEAKKHLPIELNDTHGSYVCEFGHTHDYKKIDFDAIEKEISDPDTKVYDSVEEMWAELDSED